mmetsp:Transcript_23942/g.60631  ORF Transcript_23942/g.60631 Transcript_23942/m.60631 type:complete len:80 (-) Transcript_23942:2526-2765(-)
MHILPPFSSSSPFFFRKIHTQWFEWMEETGADGDTFFKERRGGKKEDKKGTGTLKSTNAGKARRDWHRSRHGKGEESGT